MFVRVVQKCALFQEKFENWNYIYLFKRSDVSQTPNNVCVCVCLMSITCALLSPFFYEIIFSNRNEKQNYK